jgi:predicted naringenin-chalcone synthase
VGNTDSQTEKQAISELFLAALRSAALRAKLDANEIETIDTAMKSGLITPEYAMAWLHDIGLVDQVIVDEVRS